MELPKGYVRSNIDVTVVALRFQPYSFQLREKLLREIRIYIMTIVWDISRVVRNNSRPKH